jgi:Protein of unknown function DUF58
MFIFRRLLFKNFKFVYKLSQRLRYRFTSAGVLIASGMIASGIFAVDIRQSMAFQIFTIMASLLLASFLYSLSFRGQFKITRELPQFGTVHQMMRYRITVHNLGKLVQNDLLLIDDLETYLPKYEEFNKSHDPQDKNRNRFDRIIGYPRLVALIRKLRGGTIQAQAVENIAADDFMELNFELLPSRRGYVHFSSTRISRPDPLGLVRAIRKYEQKDKLLILPKTYRTPKVELKGLRKYQQGGMTQASVIGDSQEFMSLRDYRPGDPLRAIHWRSYAKTGTPVVKEFHDEFFVRQGLILDTFQEYKNNVVFEEAVSVAASFCLTLPGQDALLDLMFIGDQAYRFTSGRGLGQSENMLEVLACTEPCNNNSFSKLHELIPEYSNETSGMICVLLDWDKKRQELIESIIRASIPVVVFLIIDGENKSSIEHGPMENHPERFIVLPSDNIQSSLDEASNLSLAKE